MSTPKLVDDRTDPQGPLRRCAVCGRAADGFAAINGARVCHSDARTCYAPHLDHPEDTP